MQVADPRLLKHIWFGKHTIVPSAHSSISVRKTNQKHFYEIIKSKYRVAENFHSSKRTFEQTFTIFQNTSQTI